jgi:hypothetical protein
MSATEAEIKSQSSLTYLIPADVPAGWIDIPSHLVSKDPLGH